MSALLPISLLSTVLWATLSNALVPADPLITPLAVLPRQNNDRFIGWVESDGNWYSETCNSGLTWYQDGKYGQCCPTTLASCYAPTACLRGSLIYPYSDQSSTMTIACTDNYDNTAFSICNTAFIFENFSDSNPKTDIVCGVSAVNWSYYRKIPATATEATTSEDASASPSPASPNTQRPKPKPTDSKKSSKAWIAGVIVGPIAAIAIIGGLILSLIRRKRNKNAQQMPPHFVAAGPPVSQTPFTDAKPQFAVAGSYAPQPSPGYNPNDPYSQQGYMQPQQQQQQQPPPPPLSPAPQYGAPFSAPSSPPPPPSHAHGVDTKYAHYSDAGNNQAAELGGTSRAPGFPAPASHTAELSGENLHR